MADAVILQRSRDVAKQIAAIHFQANPDQILVKAAEPRTWSDTAIGHDVPGVASGDALTPGCLFIIEADVWELEIHTDDGERAVIHHRRVITSETLPGGWADQDISAEDVQEVTNRAIHLLQSSGVDLTLAQIVAASTQVVSGTNYHLLLDVLVNGTFRQITVGMLRSNEGVTGMTFVRGLISAEGG